MDRSDIEMETFHSKVEDATIDLKARLGTKEEHKQSVWQVMKKDPRVVFWCLFFAFSAVGW